MSNRVDRSDPRRSAVSVQPLLEAQAHRGFSLPKEGASDGGGGIDGWNSAAEAFNVTLELVRRGHTEVQIGKLWSGDLLRVWGEVEKASQQLLKKQG